MSILARNSSRKLQSLTPLERADVITVIAEELVKRQDEILMVNKKDLDKAALDGIKGPMYSRLLLTSAKIEALATGLHQIAESSYRNVGRVLRHTKVSDTLNLVQKTVPIGNNTHTCTKQLHTQNKYNTIKNGILNILELTF